MPAENFLQQLKDCCNRFTDRLANAGWSAQHPPEVPEPGVDIYIHPAYANVDLHSIDLRLEMHDVEVLDVHRLECIDVWLTQSTNGCIFMTRPNCQMQHGKLMMALCIGHPA